MIEAPISQIDKTIYDELESDEFLKLKTMVGKKRKEGDEFLDKFLLSCHNLRLQNVIELRRFQVFSERKP